MKLQFAQYDPSNKEWRWSFVEKLERSLFKITHPESDTLILTQEEFAKEFCSKNPYDEIQIKYRENEEFSARIGLRHGILGFVVNRYVEGDWDEWPIFWEDWDELFSAIKNGEYKKGRENF
jgi:hypothetical protein